MRSEATSPIILRLSLYIGMSSPLRRILTMAGLAAVILVLLVPALVVSGMPDPLGHDALAARVLDIAILVFREGLECILVLAAVTANMRGQAAAYRRPVAAGAAVAFGASLLTWAAAVRILDALSDSVPALDIQAATGLLAIVVLLVVMNWFFHKVYWTGWISMHSRTKQSLLQRASPVRIWWGLALLGFTSLYREGFEVVLFLQTYRLRIGGLPVFYGVCGGLLLTIAVGVLTFVAQQRLPYRRMLVFTGVMLGVVLLVMVGEQAQEMQLARWLPSTPVHVAVPDWMSLWFAVFPTVETLAAQAFAAIIVVGSYYLARDRQTSAAAPAA